MLRLHELTALVKKRKELDVVVVAVVLQDEVLKVNKLVQVDVKENFQQDLKVVKCHCIVVYQNEDSIMTDFSEAVMQIINLEQLNNAFEKGAIVDMAALVEKGLVSKKKSQKGMSNQMIKVLGNGTLSKKLIVNADAFSKSAITAIENLGGEARLMKGDVGGTS